MQSFFLKYRGRTLLSLLVLAFVTAPALQAVTPTFPISHQIVEEQVPVTARVFPLSHVRLLDGPFKEAQQRDMEYLLRLDPDRLLSWFRREAGLNPKGEVYGGWESQTIAGHSLGHHLSAVSMVYAATGDPRFRERAGYIVKELAACQKANGNGYLAAFPGGKQAFADIARGEIRSEPFNLNGIWVPWYTLHKVMAGLRDAYIHCDNQQALEVLTTLADWAVRTTRNLTEEQWQEMLATEHGGMNEVLADLYALTGKESYLTLAQQFYHQAVLDPLSEQRDILPGLHANTQIPKLIGLARLYELTGKDRYETAASFFWDRVVHHHTYVNGGNSAGEYFGPPDQRAYRLHATTETCNTYNMLKLTRHMFAWEPSAEYMDYYERALYNHILASQHPETGMMKYKGYLEMPARKDFSTPFNSFWCCVGTGMENHTKYGESIYYHRDNTLYVNLFIASDLRWDEQGMTIRQETDFPEETVSRLTLDCQEPTETTLKLRHPFWSRQVTISVNGETAAVSSTPSTYIALSRTWESGDRVEIRLPMHLRIESMPDKSNRIAFLYGPILLAANLMGDNPLPHLLGQPSSLTELFTPVKKASLEFQSPEIGRVFAGKDVLNTEIRLMPFYAIADQKYTVYVDTFSRTEWNREVEEHRAETERREALNRRTIDLVEIGRNQSEAAHGFAGEQTSSGRFQGRQFRHAWDGGYFTYNLTVEPDTPVDLVVTYWGSDSGSRTFDILVDGQKIATQSLDNTHPGEFFQVIYPIPEQLVRDKEQVPIRFQAHPDNTAGGVFGCRIARRE